MKLALIGTGMIVQDLLTISSEIPDLVLQAIVGRSASRAAMEELSAQHGIARVYTDYDESLADPEVDTVYIGLPNLLHADYARRALLAGKHVICEKPFTLRVEDLAELRALAETRRLVLVEAITTQYLANYRSIKERLPELGELKVIQCDYSQHSSRYAAFLDGQVPPAFDPEMGGGALMDLGIYTLHFVVGLLGRPRSITYTANVERGIDTSGVMILDYDTCTAVCVCAKDSAGTIRTKIQGNDGTIVMDGPPNICDTFTVQHRGEAAELVDRKVHPHRMVEEFRAFQKMVDHLDLTERDTRLDHSQLVLELATRALASAGVRIGA